MATLRELLPHWISEFKKIPNITDVQVEDPSDITKAQINNEPSLVFVLTVYTYVSVTPAIIKFVIPISVIMTVGLSINVPEDMIINLAHNLVLKPVDNFIQDHSYNDNLTDTAFTIYIDPEPKNLDPASMFRPMLLRGVNIHEYQGDDDYNDLVSVMKQQFHVLDVFGNIVVDPKLIPIPEHTFLAFYIKTDIPLMDALLCPVCLGDPEMYCMMTDTITFMMVVPIIELTTPDFIILQLNERIEEYQN